MKQLTLLTTSILLTGSLVVYQENLSVSSNNLSQPNNIRRSEQLVPELKKKLFAHQISQFDLNRAYAPQSNKI